MQIRTMQIEDYDAVFALWKSCSGMGLNDVDDSRSGIERFLQRNPETCLVAVEETAVIGAILVGSDGRRAYIYNTAVAPERQKQGIGSQLVQAAKKAVQKIGIAKMALVVFSHNQSGNAFWEKQGFSAREDLTYRNLALQEMTRMDT